MLHRIILALGLLMVAQVSFAGKVVIFDPKEAILRTTFAQEKLQAFESTPEFAKMKAQFDSLNAEMEILNKELEKKSMTWGDEEKTAHRAKMEGVAQDRQLALQQIKAEQNNVLKEIFDKFQPKLQDVVNKFMESKGIDFMVRREAVAAVLNEKSDVTEAVAAELDKIK